MNDINLNYSNPSHLSEEQLVLHYYGEESDTLATEQHLDVCESCREFYCSLQRVLNVVDSCPVPDRGPEYGAEVWKRVERQLPRRSRQWFPALTWPLFGWKSAAAGAAFAALLVAAFFAGRVFPVIDRARPAQSGQTALATDPQAGDRVLLVAVGDYLERSQMVLIELANANPKGSLDISPERERAEGLVSESRLYRQTAARTGNQNVASVLDEVDRVLLDIAHGPSEISPADLDKLRQRLQAEGILFKIRVLGSNVRTQEEPAPSGGRRRL